MSDRVQEIERKIDPKVAGALTLDRHAAGVFTIVPQSMGEVMEFAKLMAVSGVCVRPQFRGNPGACLAITVQAMKWGADPFAVANKAYVVKNKAGEETLAYEAQLIHAIVNASPVLTQRLRPTYDGQGASRRCRIVGYVRGEETPLEYESPPISQIGVKNSPLWVSDPDQQLFYYSSRAWARRHVPEILLGIYAPGEFEGETIDITPDGTPEPQMPIGLRPSVETDTDDRPTFEVVDGDGVVSMFRDGLRTAQFIGEHLDAAAHLGLPQLEGFWETNVECVGLLLQEGLGEQAADLQARYVELAGELTKRQATDAKRQAEEKERAEREAAAKAADQLAKDEKTAAEAQRVPLDNAAPVESAKGAISTVSSPGPSDTGDNERRVLRPAPAAAEPSQASASSLLIPMPPAKNGKPDARVWAVALFVPKIKRLADGGQVVQMLADNEANIEMARRVLDGDDKAQLERAINEAVDRTSANG